jgi:deoxyribodipyrimidine photo-lyase
MRYLIYHGWLNFRMRAMLVSIACYTLKLPWQPVSDYLAKLFVDFEPGIHYPQIQMQSGTTGQQVLRIYNPVKQAQELDPEGIFVRRWLPELGQVSHVWIFEPWRMPAEMRVRTCSQCYPLPPVDFSCSHREAKDEISMLRSGVAGKVVKGAGQKTSSRAVVVNPEPNPTPAGNDDFGQMSLFD